MFECPACGGNLRFDIACQMLHCDFCGNNYDPYMPQTDAKEPDASGEDTLSCAVFTCSACGAEIASTDLSATGFCSYCGNAAVFEKRISGQIRPARILPFAKTKENCKEAYQKAVRTAVYAPKEFRDPAFLEQFVPVYIPCWNYEVQAGPAISLDGKKSYTRGNYRYTEIYRIDAAIESEPLPFVFDASSAFDDQIYESISPFDPGAIRDFGPGFLAGFFADVSDLPQTLYLDEARFKAGALIYQRAREILSDYTVEMPEQTDTLEKKLHLQVEGKRGMLPVWFLTWKRKDRVAYSVVNGHSGQIYAELPVDLKRFFLFTLLLAIPIFILCQCFLTITAPYLLTLSCFFASVSSIVFYYQMNAIRKAENRLYDAGWHEKHGGVPRGELKKRRLARYKLKDSMLQKILLIVLILVGVCILKPSAVTTLLYGTSLLNGLMNGTGGLLSAVCFFVALIFSLRSFFISRQVKSCLGGLRGAATLLETGACMASSLLALILWLKSPADDLPYYIASAVSFACILLTVTGLIRKYNLLTTRPIPEFHQRTKDKPGGGTAAAVSSLSLLFLLLIAFPGRGTLAGGSAFRYTNPESGYSVYLSDDADLLSDAEEALLVNEMKEITKDGNAGFASGDGSYTSGRWYAEDRYQKAFGTKNGTMFVIDLGNREIRIHSDGALYQSIDNGKANSITDNVYFYASKGYYYLCASKAFEQIRAVLAGRRIAEPMKAISNLLLSLILSVLLNYLFLTLTVRQTGRRFQRDQAVPLALRDIQPQLLRKTKVRVQSGSGRGGFHGGGGFGGHSGGHSGGGGGHRF